MTAPPVGTDPAEAARVLGAGGLVAFPTETVYGLGADARRADAVRRIFAVKGRPVDHPLIVHLPGPAALEAWADPVPDAARALAAACWPGPLTLLVPRAAHVLDEVTGGRSTVGLRIPDHPVAQAMLAAFGDGVAAPSANRFGRVSPTTAAHVVADLDGDVDLVLDGGACAVGVESTIVDCSGDRPEILRTGAISAARIAEVLGRRPGEWAGEGPARAPGMLEAHYAPSARVEVTDVAGLGERLASLRAEQVSVAVLALAPDAAGVVPHEGVVVLEPPADTAAYARVVYMRLREADAAGAQVVLVVPPPATDGLGRAVGDRLRRAAASA